MCVSVVYVGGNFEGVVFEAELVGFLCFGIKERNGIMVRLHCQGAHGVLVVWGVGGGVMADVGCIGEAGETFNEADSLVHVHLGYTLADIVDVL